MARPKIAVWAPLVRVSRPASRVTKTYCARFAYNCQWFLVDMEWTWSIMLESSMFLSEVGGENWSGAEAPTGNPSPAPHAPHAPHASHARHDRSMARNRLAARPKVGGLHFSPSVSRKSVPRQLWTCCFISFILARNYNGFLVDMFSECSSPLIKIRVW